MCPKSAKCIRIFLNLNFHATRNVFHGKDHSRKTLLRLQIKNIKLHIVTDIKVGFNSLLGFRISLFGRGDGYFYIQNKLA